MASYINCSQIKTSVSIIISTTCFLKALLQFRFFLFSRDFQAWSLWRAELLQYDLKQISSNSLQAYLYPKCKSAKAQYKHLTVSIILTYKDLTYHSHRKIHKLKTSQVLNLPWTTKETGMLCACRGWDYLDLTPGLSQWITVQAV